MFENYPSAYQKVDATIPASGYRNNSNGSLNNAGSNGNYWFCSPNSTTNGYNLNFNSSNVNPSNNNNRANGFPVRCLRELVLTEKLRVSRHPFHMQQTTLLEDLFAAYYSARKNKRSTSSQLKFELNLEDNLMSLYEDLVNRTYKPSPCICFITTDPVKREIFASCFRDRVVHHLLYNYINPLFEPTFIYDSYSCRAGKGTLFGIKRLEHHIRSCTRNYTREAYVLKLDIQGYFMSIPKARLYEVIMRRLEKFRDSAEFDFDLVDFLIRGILFRNPAEGCRIIGSASEWDSLPPSKSLLCAAPGVGLPIGDLTSQLFSNIYLGELDKYVKRTLGCKHYGRYVDDFYIVDTDAGRLRALIPLLETYLRDTLGLTLHPRKRWILPTKYEVSFLGARLRYRRRWISRRNCAGIIRALQRNYLPSEADSSSISRTISSYYGLIKHFYVPSYI